MLKLLPFVLLAAMATLLACSGPAPSPTNTPPPPPTAAAVNTPTPEPTPTPRPTETPAPPPTAAPTPAEPAKAMPRDIAESGGLTPLPIDDPEAIAAELSDAELACVAPEDDVDGLPLGIFPTPELFTPEEQVQLIGCLEDETMLRLLVTGLIGQTGPLSAETSSCIRDGMRGIDLRSVLLAGTAGDEEAAMVGSMAAVFLGLSCLNDEEFEAVAPSLGMTPDDRESLQCLMEALGGPEGMTATMGSGDESAFTAVFGAAMGCGLQLDGAAPGG